MKWLDAFLFRKVKPPVPPPAEGLAAFQRGLDKMAEIDHRWSEVHRASDPLRKHLERNHFADQINSIFAGRRKQ
jgi:hypothetical protein